MLEDPFKVLLSEMADGQVVNISHSVVGNCNNKNDTEKRLIHTNLWLLQAQLYNCISCLKASLKMKVEIGNHNSAVMEQGMSLMLGFTFSVPETVIYVTSTQCVLVFFVELLTHIFNKG